MLRGGSDKATTTGTRTTRHLLSSSLHLTSYFGATSDQQSENITRAQGHQIYASLCGVTRLRLNFHHKLSADRRLCPVVWAHSLNPNTSMVSQSGITTESCQVNTDIRIVRGSIWIVVYPVNRRDIARSNLRLYFTNSHTAQAVGMDSGFNTADCVGDKRSNDPFHTVIKAGCSLGACEDRVVE